MLKTILNNGKQSWCLKQNMGLKIPNLSGNFKYCKLVLDLWIVKRLHYTSTVDQGHFQVIPQRYRTNQTYIPCFSHDAEK